MTPQSHVAETAALLRTLIVRHFGLTPRERRSVLVLLMLLALGTWVRYSRLLGATGA